jgi:hypothetical protein
MVFNRLNDVSKLLDNNYQLFGDIEIDPGVQQIIPGSKPVDLPTIYQPLHSRYVMAFD